MGRIAFSGCKLSEPKILSAKEWQEISETLGRPWGLKVELHWMHIIQPTILQYFARTLNLPIYKLLINFISETFGDGGIDWKLVLERKEFNGLTIKKLKNVFNQLKQSTGRKFKLSEEE